MHVNAGNGVDGDKFMSNPCFCCPSCWVNGFIRRAGREKLQRSVLQVREGASSEAVTGMAFKGMTVPGCYDEHSMVKNA